MDPYREFNPGDPRSQVDFVLHKLMRQPLERLPPASRLEGGGIYALYYVGGFGPYQHPSISSAVATQPIYIGKGAITKSSGPQPLFDRLQKHSETIERANNTLSIEDFRCRALVLPAFWARAIEDIIIAHFRPLWNKDGGGLTGFGNNPPSTAREGSDLEAWKVANPGKDPPRVPLWHALRPGAEWATRMFQSDQQTRALEHVEAHKRSWIAPSQDITPSEIEQAVSANLNAGDQDEEA